MIPFRSTNNLIRAAFVFGFASLSSWMPLFNVWLLDNGFNGIQIGYIAALPWLTMLFVQPVWGFLADKYGKMLCLKISILSASMLFFVFPWLEKQMIPVIVMILALALFNNPILPLLDSLSLDYIEAKEDISYSNIRFWGAPGYGLGALITGWLIPFFGVQVSFYTGGIFLILMLLVLHLMESSATTNKSIDLEFSNMSSVFTNKSLLLFLMVIVVVSIAQSAITFFLTLYLREIGASPELTGTAIGIQAFSELPFYFIGAWLLRRMKPEKVVIIAIVATSVRLFLYSINHQPNNVLFIETMNGMTWTLLWISSVEYVNKIVLPKWRSTGQSMLWAAYFGAGAIIGNVVSGHLYDALSMHRVFAINGILVFIIVILSAIPFLSGTLKRFFIMKS